MMQIVLTSQLLCHQEYCRGAELHILKLVSISNCEMQTMNQITDCIMVSDGWLMLEDKNCKQLAASLIDAGADKYQWK